jgi:hypothetical protein
MKLIITSSIQELIFAGPRPRLLEPEDKEFLDSVYNPFSSCRQGLGSPSGGGFGKTRHAPIIFRGSTIPRNSKTETRGRQRRWRRERDSNCRYGFPYNGFQVEPFCGREPSEAKAGARRRNPEPRSGEGTPGRSGGGRGIRTPDTVSRIAVFKTACFNRSHIPPREAYIQFTSYPQLFCGPQ